MICDTLGVDSAGEAAEGANHAPVCAVLFDARGHGDSSGWEPAAQCIQQFHWRSLAIDMISVAERHQISGGDGRGSLMGGFSMGASSALWAAFLYPTAVRGLVLLCVTTAWEIRAQRRGNLIKNADELEASDQCSACVVRGAAFADLPQLEDIRAARLPMPVLILASRDDATHPAEVAEQLARVMPHGQAVITDTKDELSSAFPDAFRSWYQQHFACPAPGDAAA